MGPNDSFRKFLDLTKRKEHIQWYPQYRFIYDGNGDKLVDFIGRYENYDNDKNLILNKVGVECGSSPHINSSNSIKHIQLYDQETREIIAERYLHDISLFGYAFPGI